eukprot:TRINITY_DN23487_c0_g1_i1.p1 TRINITY_DN23487_c0_g1~~TRINITY_DN23487_c0_g1_i1.p1  ORF type:complete len:2044 (+),score=603.98 TRINITY_DN23487_c0_g1_i1:167-6298(+)
MADSTLAGLGQLAVSAGNVVVAVHTGPPEPEKPKKERMDLGACKILTEDVAFPTETTLATLIDPHNLNDAGLQDIYNQREDDFEEPEVCEMWYVAKNGKTTSETMFVDTLYDEERPRICVSVKAVHAMHRAIAVLTRKLDNTLITLRSCRKGYHEELTHLRDLLSRQDRGLGFTKSGRVEPHDAFMFNPAAYQDEVTLETFKERMKEATESLEAQLTQKQATVSKLQQIISRKSFGFDITDSVEYHEMEEQLRELSEERDSFRNDFEALQLKNKDQDKKIDSLEDEIQINAKQFKKQLERQMAALKKSEDNHAVLERQLKKERKEFQEKVAQQAQKYAEMASQSKGSSEHLDSSRRESDVRLGASRKRSVKIADEKEERKPSRNNESRRTSKGTVKTKTTKFEEQNEAAAFVSERQGASRPKSPFSPPDELKSKREDKKAHEPHGQKLTVPGGGGEADEGKGGKNVRRGSKRKPSKQQHEEDPSADEKTDGKAAQSLADRASREAPAAPDGTDREEGAAEDSDKREKREKNEKKEQPAAPSKYQKWLDEKRARSPAPPEGGEVASSAADAVKESLPEADRKEARRRTKSGDKAERQEAKEQKKADAKAEKLQAKRDAKRARKAAHKEGTKETLAWENGSSATDDADGSSARTGSATASEGRAAQTPVSPPDSPETAPRKQSDDAESSAPGAASATPSPAATPLPVAPPPTAAPGEAVSAAGHLENPAELTASPPQATVQEQRSQEEQQAAGGHASTVESAAAQKAPAPVAQAAAAASKMGEQAQAPPDVAERPASEDVDTMLAKMLSGTQQEPLSPVPPADNGGPAEQKNGKEVTPLTDKSVTQGANGGNLATATPVESLAVPAQPPVATAPQGEETGGLASAPAQTAAAEAVLGGAEQEPVAASGQEPQAGMAVAENKATAPPKRSSLASSSGSEVSDVSSVAVSESEEGDSDESAAESEERRSSKAKSDLSDSASEKGEERKRRARKGSVDDEQTGLRRGSLTSSGTGASDKERSDVEYKDSEEESGTPEHVSEGLEGSIEQDLYGSETALNAPESLSHLPVQLQAHISPVLESGANACLQAVLTLVDSLAERQKHHLMQVLGVHLNKDQAHAAGASHLLSPSSLASHLRKSGGRAPSSVSTATGRSHSPGGESGISGSDMMSEAETGSRPGSSRPNSSAQAFKRGVMKARNYMAVTTSRKSVAAPVLKKRMPWEDHIDETTRGAENSDEEAVEKSHKQDQAARRKTHVLRQASLHDVTKGKGDDPAAPSPQRGGALSSTAGLQLPGKATTSIAQAMREACAPTSPIPSSPGEDVSSMLNLTGARLQGIGEEGELLLGSSERDPGVPRERLNWKEVVKQSRALQKGDSTESAELQLKGLGQTSGSESDRPTTSEREGKPRVRKSMAELDPEHLEHLSHAAEQRRKTAVGLDGHVGLEGSGFLPAAGGGGGRGGMKEKRKSMVGEGVLQNAQAEALNLQQHLGQLNWHKSTTTATASVQTIVSVSCDDPEEGQPRQQRGHFRFLWDADDSSFVGQQAQDEALLTAVMDELSTLCREIAIMTSGGEGLPPPAAGAAGMLKLAEINMDAGSAATQGTSLDGRERRHSASAASRLLANYVRAMRTKDDEAVFDELNDGKGATLRRATRMQARIKAAAAAWQNKVHTESAGPAGVNLDLDEQESSLGFRVSNMTLKRGDQESGPGAIWKRTGAKVRLDVNPDLLQLQGKRASVRLDQMPLDALQKQAAEAGRKKGLGSRPIAEEGEAEDLNSDSADEDAQDKSVASMSTAAPSTAAGASQTGGKRRAGSKEEKDKIWRSAASKAQEQLMKNRIALTLKGFEGGDDEFGKDPSLKVSKAMHASQQQQEFPFSARGFVSSAAAEPQEKKAEKKKQRHLGKLTARTARPSDHNLPGLGVGLELPVVESATMKEERKRHLTALMMNSAANKGGAQHSADIADVVPFAAPPGVEELVKKSRQWLNSELKKHGDVLLPPREQLRPASKGPPRGSAVTPFGEGSPRQEGWFPQAASSHGMRPTRGINHWQSKK